MIVTEMFGDSGRPTLLMTVDHDYTTPNGAWLRLQCGEIRISLQFNRMQIINLRHQLGVWLDRPRPLSPLKLNEPIMQEPEPVPMGGDPFGAAAKPKPKSRRKPRR